jgi:hypothetical protein
MREIHEHQVNEANGKLSLHAMDEPGSGGASHLYHVGGFDTTNNPSELRQPGYQAVDLLFQNGPIKEVGVNGLTHEVLLAVIADRLRAFQKGAYACRENALALTKIEEAQHWLAHRTRAREARGVEGTHEV